MASCVFFLFIKLVFLWKLDCLLCSLESSHAILLLSAYAPRLLLISLFIDPAYTKDSSRSTLKRVQTSILIPSYCTECSAFLGVERKGLILIINFTFVWLLQLFRFNRQCTSTKQENQQAVLSFFCWRNKLGIRNQAI